jgi:transcriptional regulator with XRE-family HTH domain
VADLSQRELAERSGVPKSTIARIEAGQGGEARLRTIERLVRAAGGELTIGLESRAGREEQQAPLQELPEVPHEELRDEAGRRYPAHLDVWPVRGPKDWPGAWWSEWYDLPPERYPLRLPPAAYERNRRHRDARRRVDRIRAQVRVCRRHEPGRPEGAWRFVAGLPDGRVVGELTAHERCPHLDPDLPMGWQEQAERGVVLDACLVAVGYRRLGIGRRLVTALVEEMGRAGVTRAYALAPGGAPLRLLRECGFRVGPGRPAELRLRLAPTPTPTPHQSAGPTLLPSGPTPPPSGP